MFSPEKLLWFCVNVFFLMQIFKEAGLVASTIILLAAAVVNVCKPPSPPALVVKRAKEGDCLWVPQCNRR